MKCTKAHKLGPKCPYCEIERLQRIIDEIVKETVFKCPDCLTKLKNKAIRNADYEAANEYRILLEKIS